jgi:hypothetical protein
MDSAHICINLSAKSAKHDVAEAAQPVNVCESQHGNDDSESNSTPLLKSVENDDADDQILTLHILQQYHIERGERIFYAVLLIQQSNLTG